MLPRLSLPWQIAAGAALAVCLALTRIPGQSPPISPARSLFNRTYPPKYVEASLQASCSNCHSNQTKWPWYADLPVASYFIQRDVGKARVRMNLSDWQATEERGPDELAAAFSGICENLLSGAMPKPAYVWLHPEARLSKEEISRVCEWTEKQQMSVLLSAQRR